MDVPAIGSYPMPDTSALPRSRVSWRIDPARAALPIHHMQNHFVGTLPTGRRPVVDLVDKTAALRRLANMVLLTAADAFMNDIQRFVVADAVADFSAEEHRLALRWAARSGAVSTTAGLLRGLLLHREPRNA